MLTLVIKGSFETACKLIQQAPLHAEAFEIRLDLICDLNFEKLSFLRNLTEKKVIFTLRTKDQGGEFIGSFQDYKNKIFSFLSLQPDYIDIEMGTPQQIINAIKLHSPLTKVILSSHHFKPISSIAKGFRSLRKYKADIYKLASTGGPVEALEMFAVTKKLVNKNICAVGIIMGQEGSLSRILSKVAGNYFTFCSDNPHLGQLSIEMLIDVYHVQKTSLQTKVYGLIGNPVTASPSHMTHNMLLRQYRLDAIYVKIPLEDKDLVPFLKKALKVFEGFSITAPYKEKVVPLVKKMTAAAQKIGAINTLKKIKGGWLGENTDRLGAIKSLETLVNLHGKRCLIVGAGGVSKAIYYELVKAKAHVTILNRSKQKQDFFSLCDFFCFDEIDKLSKDIFDVIIQATSCELYRAKLPQTIDLFFQNQPLVFETIIEPRLTCFLKQAIIKKCNILEGYHMFLNQAVFQFKFWFNHLDEHELLKNLTKNYLVLDL